jgi:hypothetical protein
VNANLGDRGELPLPAKEREDQTQHDADDDAGDDWEIKNRVAAFDPDVAWKFAQKSRADAAPENDSDNDKCDADEDEKFSDLRHDSILVSNSMLSSTGRQRCSEPAGIRVTSRSPYVGLGDLEVVPSS